MNRHIFALFYTRQNNVLQKLFIMGISQAKLKEMIITNVLLRDTKQRLKLFVIGFRKMARVTGLEPATSGVTGRHSNQLSYTRALFEPVL